MWSLGKQVRQLKYVKAGTVSMTNELLKKKTRFFFYDIGMQIGPNGIPRILSLRPLHITTKGLG